MNKLRYPEKKFLLKYDLNFQFFRELGLNVTEVVPLRKVFLLKTDIGNKILKCIDYDEDKINFINISTESIAEEYKNIITLKKFEDGKCYKNWNGKNYIVMDLIKGREVVFTNIVELKRCAEELAKFHIAGNKKLGTIKKVMGEKIERFKEATLIDRYKERLSALKYIKSVVQKYKCKNEFDSIFINMADNYLIQSERICSLLNNKKVIDYENDGKNKVLCHNDLANHNFLIKNNDIYLLDFDYASIDLRIADVADLLLKGIKNVAFDFKKGMEVLEAYNKIYKLEQLDYYMIYIAMSFPRDIYTIVNNYYFKEKEWDYDIFLDRFKNKIENEEDRIEFLEKFKTASLN